MWFSLCVCPYVWACVCVCVCVCVCHVHIMRSAAAFYASSRRASGDWVPRVDGGRPERVHSAASVCARCALRAPRGAAIPRGAVTRATTTTTTTTTTRGRGRDGEALRGEEQEPGQGPEEERGGAGEQAEGGGRQASPRREAQERRLALVTFGGGRPPPQPWRDFRCFHAGRPAWKTWLLIPGGGALVFRGNKKATPVFFLKLESTEACVGNTPGSPRPVDLSRTRSFF